MSIIALDIACAVNAAKWGFFQGSYGPGTVSAPVVEVKELRAAAIQVWQGSSEDRTWPTGRYLSRSMVSPDFLYAFINYLLDARGVALMVGASAHRFEPPIDDRVLRAQYLRLADYIFRDWLLDAQVISLLVRSAYTCDDVQFDDLVHCSERRRASQFCTNCDGGGWVFDEDNRYKQLTCPICHGDGAV